MQLSGDKDLLLFVTNFNKKGFKSVNEILIIGARVRSLEADERERGRKRE